jgi:hypothetical protein
MKIKRNNVNHAFITPMCFRTLNMKDENLKTFLEYKRHQTWTSWNHVHIELGSNLKNLLKN